MNEFKRKIAYNDKTILNVIHSTIRLARLVTLAALTHIIFVTVWYSTVAHSVSPKLNIKNFDAYWQSATGFWILLGLFAIMIAILHSYMLGRFLQRFWSAIIYLGFTGLFLSAYNNFSYLMIVGLVAVFGAFNLEVVHDHIADIWEELYDDSDYKAVHRFVKADVKQDDLVFELFHDRQDGSTTVSTQHVSDMGEPIITCILSDDMDDLEKVNKQINEELNIAKDNTITDDLEQVNKKINDELNIANDSTINNVLSAKFGSAEALTNEEFKQLLKDTPQDEGDACSDLFDVNEVESSTEDSESDEGEIGFESDTVDTIEVESSTEDSESDEGETSSKSDTDNTIEVESATEDSESDEGETHPESDTDDTIDVESYTEDSESDEGEIDPESDTVDTIKVESSTEDSTSDGNETHSDTEDVQEIERLKEVRRKIQEQKSRHRRRV